MLSRLNTVLLAKFDAEIGGGTSVYLRAVFCVSLLSLFRLKITPIEGERCRIEKLREVLFILFVLLTGLKLIKHKEICSEAEFMAPLIYSYLRLHILYHL